MLDFRSAKTLLLIRIFPQNFKRVYDRVWVSFPQNFERGCILWNVLIIKPKF